MNDAVGDERFVEHRRLIFGIAYRMLGSVTDAEDVVQDAWLRWRNSRISAVRTPRSFLATTATNLCLDRLRRLNAERRRYTGPWLPEPWFDSAMSAANDVEAPVAEGGLTGPEMHADWDWSLRLAVLRMMERLTPKERAVFVLREVFGFEFDAIGTMLNTEAATARQWFRRARVHLQGAQRFTVDRQAHAQAMQQFADAIANGDAEAAAALLANDAQLHTDGGGVVSAARIVVHGAQRITQMLMHLARQRGPVEWVVCNGNGGLMALAQLGGELDAVVAIEVIDGHIVEIDVVRNPNKLLYAHT